MESTTSHVLSREVQTGAVSFKYALQPLEKINKPTVDTADAAYYLNRRPQTLRAWACFENGPLRPCRINGRLAWQVSELKRVLGVSA